MLHKYISPCIVMVYHILFNIIDFQTSDKQMDVNIMMITVIFTMTGKHPQAEN